MECPNAVSEDDLHIPLIDFSKYLNGTTGEKRSTSTAILNGFRTAGFIYIYNHPITRETTSRIFRTSARFFSRPQSQKNSLAWTTPESNRGYSCPGREKVSSLEDRDAIDALRIQAPDLKESFEIGRDDAPEHANRWPDGIDGIDDKDDDARVFKGEMKDFFETCKELHVQIMRALALGMGLDEGFFDAHTDRGDNTLRLLHYPAVPRSVFQAGEGSVRAGEHSDYGSITLLFQDDRGGLQVKSPRNTFVNATPIADTIVVNAGDLLARWSNDTIRSTVHRVVAPPAVPAAATKELSSHAGEDAYPSRYSVAYFCHPNFDSFIDAIPGTFEAEGKKYAGVNSGEYLVSRLTATH
ncbi:MAG: hypothetical protein M1825_003434 [Sarcosagium campestre]|nr:MAG: hypothetical protein M1825_003434 [Sarcosagium campestre]